MKPYTATPSETEDPRTDLWCAVILQALTDATAPVPAEHITADGRVKGSIASDRRAARAWFKLKNPDFIEVCSLAGLDPEAVVEHATLAIAECNRAEEQGLRSTSPKLPRKTSEPRPKRTIRTVTFQGETVPLRALCKQRGLPYARVAARLDRGGFTIEQALSTERASRKTGHRGTGREPDLITHNGMTMTWKQWAEHLGVSLFTLHDRRKNGWTLERTLTTSNAKQAARYLHNGENLTLAEWSVRTGMSQPALRKRLELGWSVERALTEPSRQDRGEGSKQAEQVVNRRLPTTRDCTDITFEGAAE